MPWSIFVTWQTFSLSFLITYFQRFLGVRRLRNGIIQRNYTFFCIRSKLNLKIGTDQRSHFLNFHPLFTTRHRSIDPSLIQALVGTAIRYGTCVACSISTYKSSVSSSTHRTAHSKSFLSFSGLLKMSQAKKISNKKPKYKGNAAARLVHQRDFKYVHTTCNMKQKKRTVSLKFWDLMGRT